MSQPPRESLRRQLLIRLSAPLLVVLACSAVLAYALARHIGHAVHDQWLYDSAMTLVTQIKVKDGQIALELPTPAIEMFLWDRVDRIYEEVSSDAQGLISSNGRFPSPPKQLVLDKPLYYDGSIGGRPVRIVAIMLRPLTDADDTVRIQVAETLHKREAVTQKVILLSAPLQILIQVLAALLIWLAVTRSLRRVDEIAAHLRGYDPNRLVPISDNQSTPQEIEPLVHAINGLIEKLDGAQEAQRRFIANAAHQMRTPLAALQVQTQRALREHDPLKHGEALAEVFNAVTRLRRVVQQLLTLTRSENAAESMLRMHRHDLASLAREEIERWTDAAIERDIDLGYEGPEGSVMVSGEAHLLRELIGNLLDNAIRYNRRGGIVTLSISEAPLRLCVDDDGPGIPEGERELVLERFYRLSDSEYGGCGLGLSIAKEIAARHGARLKISANPAGAGTRVEVVFQSDAETDAKAA